MANQPLLPVAEGLSEAVRDFSQAICPHGGCRNPAHVLRGNGFLNSSDREPYALLFGVEVCGAGRVEKRFAISGVAVTQCLEVTHGVGVTPEDNLGEHLVCQHAPVD